MLETHFRQAATLLLEGAIRIAPPDTRDWGLAMRGELNHVEAPWAAVVWALGGASVLARRALAALLLPGRHGQGIPPEPGLFAEDASMRRAMLITGGGCILAALLLLAAPPLSAGATRRDLTVGEGCPFELKQWPAPVGSSRPAGGTAARPRGLGLLRGSIKGRSRERPAGE